MPLRHTHIPSAAAKDDTFQYLYWAVRVDLIVDSVLLVFDFVEHLVGHYQERNILMFSYCRYVEVGVYTGALLIARDVNELEVQRWDCP